MQVREIMSSPATTVGPDTLIREVARVMRENQISGVPVVNETGALMGLITELDLIARNAPIREPRYLAVLSAIIPLSLEEYREYKEQLRQALAISAGDLMTADVAAVAPDTPVEEALEMMLDAEVITLPVVEGDRVVGVVSRTDMVRLIEELESAPDEPPAA
jgi:CBS domain-containing protein